MSLNSLSNFIANYSLLIVIVVAILFLLYHLYLKPKYFSGEKKKESDAVDSFLVDDTQKSGEKESAKTRMARGLKVMQKKLQQNEFIKNIQESQLDSNPYNSIVDELNKDSNKHRRKKEVDPFATDFSNLGCEI